jgi:hypothetical protein
MAQADEPAAAPAEDAVEAEKSRKRLEFLNKAAARFELHVNGEAGAVSNVVPTPLLRWTNPHSSAKDGVLIAFSHGGRPDALAQIAVYSETNVVHEFQSTCEQPVAMQRDGRTFWEYGEPGIQFQALAKVSPPADSESLRTIQLRQIAESFQVFDEHGWNTPVRQPLRLLRQPVHRYHDSQAGILDGAVFAFVLGTDPEATLMVEAVQEENGPQWRFAFSEMTIYALQAFRQEEMVWNKPDRRVFCRSNVAHYVCPYSPSPDDPSLKGLMPSATSPASAK